jgi:LEA14-like dessication related protein
LKAPLLITRMAILTLSGCLSYKEVELKAVNDVAVERLDRDGLGARVNVTIHNPNGYRIKVIDPDVDLFLDDVNVGKVLLDSAMVLEKRSTRSYTIPLHASFAGRTGPALFTIMAAALRGRTKLGAKGTVTAKAMLLRKRFPFELEHPIDLNDQ